MSYLEKKPGSLEELISQKTKLEAGYQDKFKKELEKAGKGIGSMTPAEKSAFFNKIDKMHTAKNEEVSKDSAYAIGMAQAKKSMKDEPPLDKKTITKGHEIAKSILKKEETIVEFTSQQIKMAYGVANDKRYKAGNYSGAVAAIEKIAKGLSKHPDVEKVLKRVNEDQEIDETHMGQTKKANQSQKDAGGEKEPVSIKKESLQDTIKNIWLNAAEGYEQMVPNKKDDESDKKRKTTMTGEKPSQVEMEPEVKYNK